MGLDIGTLAGYLDLDTTPFDRKLGQTEDKARRQGRKSGDAFAKEHSRSLKDRLDNDADKIMDLFGGKLAAAARPVAAAAAAGMASQIVTSLAAGLAAGAVKLAHGFAAGLALLPSVALAAGLALGTVKLALSGVSDALKAGLSGDVRKFNEALKGMPPSARAVLREIVGMKGGLDQLKATVQENFFRPLVGQLQPLGDTYLPIVTKESSTLARTLGQVGSSVVSWLSIPSVADQIAGALDNANIAVGNVASAAGTLPQAFLPLVIVGSQFLPQLTDGLGGLTSRLASFMLEAQRTGELEQFIQGGIDKVASFRDGLEQAGQIARNVLGGLSDLFADVEMPSAGVLDSLEGISEQFRAWAATEQAQRLVQQVLDFLANTDWGGVLALAGAMATMSKVFTAMSGAQGAISTISSLASLGPVGWVILGIAAALAALVGGFVIAYKSSEDFRDFVSGSLLPALQEFGQWFSEEILPNLERWGAVIVGVVVAGWQGLMDSIERNRPQLEALGNLLREGAEVWWPMVADAMANAAIAVGIVFAVLIGLVEILGFVIGMIQGLKDKAGEAFGWMRDNWPQLLGILTAPLLLAAAFIRDRFGEIKGWASNAKDWIVGRFDDLVGAVGGLGGRIRGAASGMFDGIKDAFRAAINSIISWWNGLTFPSISIPEMDPLGSFGPSIGGGSFGGWSLPNIPMLARGAIATGPTLAMIGEGSQNEAVVPLGTFWETLGRGFATVVEAIRTSVDRLAVDVRGQVPQLIEWMDQRVARYLEYITRGVVALIQLEYAGPRNLLVYEDLTTNFRRGQGRFVPGFHDGGLAPGTGELLALLMGGEEVLTRNDPRHVANLGGGAGAAAAAGRPVRIVLDASNLDRALQEWLRELVRVDGGGDVQVAFGAAA